MLFFDMLEVRYGSVLPENFRSGHLWAFELFKFENGLKIDKASKF